LLILGHAEWGVGGGGREGKQEKEEIECVHDGHIGGAKQ